MHLVKLRPTFSVPPIRYCGKQSMGLKSFLNYSGRILAHKRTGNGYDSSLLSKNFSNSFFRLYLWQGFFRRPGPRTRARFILYSQFVRKISFSKHGFSCLIDATIVSALSEIRAQLPNLQELGLAVKYYQVFPLINTSFAPHLQHVSLYDWPASNDQAPLIAFLHCLPEFFPSLQCLELPSETEPTPLSTPIFDCVDRLHNLTTLKCPLRNSDTSRFLQQLSQRSALKYLTLIIHNQIELQETNPIEFHHLSNLGVMGRHDQVLILMKSIFSSPTSFYAVCNSHEPTPLGGVLQSMPTCVGPHLEAANISIWSEIDSTASCPFDIVLPLQVYHSLLNLYLDLNSLMISDQQIEQLGKAWPRLRSIVMTFVEPETLMSSPDRSTTCSLSGILRLASVCHDLTQINIPFDGTRDLNPTAYVGRDGVELTVSHYCPIENPMEVAEFLAASFTGVKLDVISVCDDDDDVDGGAGIERKWRQANAILLRLVRARKDERMRMRREMREKDMRLREFEKQVLALQNNGS